MGQAVLYRGQRAPVRGGDSPEAACRQRLGAAGRRRIIGALLLLAAAKGAAAALPGVIAQQPLETTHRAEPNIMLLLDSSGSMATAVADGSETRLQVAQRAATSLVNSLQGVRLGLARYVPPSAQENGWQGGASILVPLDSVGGQRAALLSGIDGLGASGGTPLAQSLISLGRYFSEGAHDRDLLLHPGAASPGPSVRAGVLFDLPYATPATADARLPAPVQYSCQKNFIVALTDGLPDGDYPVNDYLADYDGDCASGTCESHDRKPGRTYATYGSDYLDDVAQALYEIDLRPDLLNASGRTVLNNVETHLIGFADSTLADNPLLRETVAQSGGRYRVAGNEAELVTAFQDVANSILTQSGSAASVAFNGPTLQQADGLFHASYDTQRWGGDLQRLALGADGEAGVRVWSAAERLALRNPASRVMLTQANGQGVPLLWSSLTAAQQADLRTGSAGEQESLASGQARLDYLRGDRALEGENLRLRSSPLGDIVHSTPVYVGAPALDWPSEERVDNGFGASGARYQAFRQGAAAQRTPVVYVGANDGMLHGFHAESGEELLAYLPEALFSSTPGRGMHALTDPDYQHRYGVDLRPAISDVYLRVQGAAAWRTLLVGGLGAGGRALFALDITDPARFRPEQAASVALWEFTADDEAALGYSFSEPVIGLLNDGRWAAILGNGYASGTGQASLLIVYLDGGLDGTWTLNQDYRRLDTVAVTGGNGLSSPSAVDLDGNGTLDRVYAGDLQGNLWAFDLQSSQPGEWQVAHRSGNGRNASAEPLLRAQAADGVSGQPITAAPLVIRHPEGSQATADLPDLLVLVGTGQYLAQGDDLSTAPQSFYAVWDRGQGGIERSGLASRRVIESGGDRWSDGAAINWRGNAVHGWVLDLPAAGERVVARAQVIGFNLFFQTLVPNQEPCSSGGSGWMMALSVVTGLAPEEPAFDRNRDQRVDDGDRLARGEQQPEVTVGLQLSSGLPSRPVYLDDQQYTGDSQGGVSRLSIRRPSAYALGRLSWQERVAGE